MLRIIGHLGILQIWITVTGCAVSSNQDRMGQSPPRLGWADGDILCGRSSRKSSPEQPASDPGSATYEAPLVSDRQADDRQVVYSSSVGSGESQTTTSDGIDSRKAVSLLFQPDQKRDNSLPVVSQAPIHVEQTSFANPVGSDAAITTPDGKPGTKLRLQDVIDSVHASYPLLKAAFLSRQVADGELISTRGAFDLKFKGGGTSAPLGYYKTYRFGVGVSQPLFSGGELFGGYKIGRGTFQPWFGERQTNDGGEFSAGIAIPLAQNRRIDERRAALFRATFDRNSVEPDIQTQIIAFVWESSYAYWEWVAAGRNYQIAQSLVEIAQKRNKGLQKRVDVGDLPRIELTDNQRLIVSRQEALIAARRKLRQSAIKLSLFLRTPDGQPIVPSDIHLPTMFPHADSVDPQDMEDDIARAMSNRPELRYLDFLRRQLEVDLNQARNLVLPNVDAVVFASKDVGGPTSSKRDKTPLEFEASLQVNIPLQRRKALGKIQAIEGKLAQLSAKIQFTQDKVRTDVQEAYATLTAAFERIGKALESLELARTMEQAERRRFDLGNSNMLMVNLRELATASAAKNVLEARLDYFQALADYRAAIALDVNLEGTP